MFQTQWSGCNATGSQSPAEPLCEGRWEAQVGVTPLRCHGRTVARVLRSLAWRVSALVGALAWRSAVRMWVLEAGRQGEVTAGREGGHEAQRKIWQDGWRLGNGGGGVRSLEEEEEGRGEADPGGGGVRSLEEEGEADGGGGVRSLEEEGEADGSMVSRSFRPSVWRIQRSRSGSPEGAESQQNSGKRLRQMRLLMCWGAGEQRCSTPEVLPEEEEEEEEGLLSADQPGLWSPGAGWGPGKVVEESWPCRRRADVRQIEGSQDRERPLCSVAWRRSGFGLVAGVLGSVEDQRSQVRVRRGAVHHPAAQSQGPHRHRQPQTHPEPGTGRF
ncbi:LOW QUALITY PROTEIN: hypothetical protein CRUP_000494 [Coryphaenoides rupestris]|nr:LOW QUALITY PROTEIN: hypothetical protein CRUP_000494 [Coryphaenoides rupestris]